MTPFPTADLSPWHFALVGALWALLLGWVLVQCWRAVCAADEQEAREEQARQAGQAGQERETSTTGSSR